MCVYQYKPQQSKSSFLHWPTPSSFTYVTLISYHSDQRPKLKMKCAKHTLPWAFLPLAFSLLLCFAACVDSRKHGHGRNWGEQASGGKNNTNTWCIAKPSADNFNLISNINYSCGQYGVNCRPIQPGGTCFLPDTTISHASYAMNLFYKAAGKHDWDCHFNGTGIIVYDNPSTVTCDYPL